MVCDAVQLGVAQLTSAANHPGYYFFSYSWFALPDSVRLILAASPNGLHAISSETEWDSAIRVYDADLKLKWEKTKLASGKKDILTYADGLVVTGCGNGWAKNYTGNDWKKIIGYRIGSGDVAWTCDLSAYDFTCIPNVPFFNGSFYAESQGSPPHAGKLFRISARTDNAEELIDYGRPITSCAPSIIAQGHLLSGDLWEDRIVVTRLANEAAGDWPGPFGDPQTNQYRATSSPLASQGQGAMREVRPGIRKESD